MKYVIGSEFIVEKTTDRFVEVVFTYDNKIWEGALPVCIRYLGYEITIEELHSQIEHLYKELNPKNLRMWKMNSDNLWTDKTTQTFKVYDALKSGSWECRVCGPVPRVNPQPAARIRDIKKKGFVIATKRKYCSKCNKKTIHDILIRVFFKGKIQNEELRKPIPDVLVNRIISVLNSTEAVFNQTRTKKELIIDHKFPSQRWTEPESKNVTSMTNKQIKAKFQLLSNQTNMLKSRECDRCVFKNKRGQFLGIKWYYRGDENWGGCSKNDESGCVGCPWYDVIEWKSQLKKVLQKRGKAHKKK